MSRVFRDVGVSFAAVVLLVILWFNDGWKSLLYRRRVFPWLVQSMYGVHSTAVRNQAWSLYVEGDSTLFLSRKPVSVNNEVLQQALTALFDGRNSLGLVVPQSYGRRPR